MALNFKALTEEEKAHMRKVLLACNMTIPYALKTPEEKAASDAETLHMLWFIVGMVFGSIFMSIYHAVK